MSQRTEFSKDFSKNKQRIDELLQIDKSFDLLYRVVKRLVFILLTVSVKTKLWRRY